MFLEYIICVAAKNIAREVIESGWLLFKAILDDFIMISHNQDPLS